MIDAFDSFINAVSVETHVQFEKIKSGHYEVNIEFEGGRQQRCTVRLSKDDSGDLTIEYYSVICEVLTDNVQLFKNALRLNLALTYGALSLMGNHLILKQTTWLKSNDPVRFIKSLTYVAAMADELEEKLTGDDLQ